MPMPGNVSAGAPTSGYGTTTSITSTATIASTTAGVTAATIIPTTTVVTAATIESAAVVATVSVTTVAIPVVRIATVVVTWIPITVVGVPTVKWNTNRNTDKSLGLRSGEQANTNKCQRQEKEFLHSSEISYLMARLDSSLFYVSGQENVRSYAGIARRVEGRGNQRLTDGPGRHVATP